MSKIIELTDREILAIINGLNAAIFEFEDVNYADGTPMLRDAETVKSVKLKLEILYDTTPNDDE